MECGGSYVKVRRLEGPEAVVEAKTDKKTEKRQRQRRRLSWLKVERLSTVRPRPRSSQKSAAAHKLLCSNQSTAS